MWGSIGSDWGRGARSQEPGARMNSLHSGSWLFCFGDFSSWLLAPGFSAKKTAPRRGVRGAGGGELGIKLNDSVSRSEATDPVNYLLSEGPLGMTVPSLFK